MNQNELMKDMELTDSGIVISGFNVPNQLGTFWQISNLNKEILDMEVQQTTVPTFFDAISCIQAAVGVAHRARAKKTFFPHHSRHHQ